ncbi:MAG: PQQ-binding-like beta-propeller repeat protein [Oscillospiraceae bacterium]|nr:PQQ-binding-like beta-propeller repeat protein [Oscillospiraceae bacterium]
MKIKPYSILKLTLILTVLLYAVTACANGADSGDTNSGDVPGDNATHEPNVQITPKPSPITPRAAESTNPDKFLSSTSIMAGGQILDSYEFSPHTSFDIADLYAEAVIDGITTFRGNNFRDSASYGRAQIDNAEISEIWSRQTASLAAPDGAQWPGHGWTGQPNIVSWPTETRAFMNMYDWAREQDKLIEVIYPAMDGYIYFQELETGKDTRDKLYIGWTFKGCGTIDPRGYPLLYVGAGYDSYEGVARIFIISLIDGSVLYTFGNDDGFAPRTLPDSHSYADSSPLIDADNDRLIYPSENGLLYILDLNSSYNSRFGTVSVAPMELVKWRFTGNRHEREGNYWYGIESSAAIYGGYAFFADNAGYLICLDINTLTPVWVQDILDDSNSSPVLTIENDHPYIYISTSFHGGWRAPMDSSATVPVWKIDAITGEIIWQVNYTCYTSSGVSGGVQATIASGKHDLENLIFVPIARTPTMNGGILAAIDKNTGSVVWEYGTNDYSWSSPVCVYSENGKGYIVYVTSNGDMLLLDGLSGELCDIISLGSFTEASPAVYENIIVVGTKGQQIKGVKIS